MLETHASHPMDYTRKTNASILEEIGVSKPLLHIPLTSKSLVILAISLAERVTTWKKAIMHRLDELMEEDRLEDIFSVIVTFLLKVVIYVVVFGSRAASHDRNEPTN